MSNLETVPEEVICEFEQNIGDSEVLSPRDVPLGGVRAMNVRRTLPQKRRSLIGAWCFVDHYGPDLVSESGGMNVPRHPHTGLATVSWLFSGKINHLDSAGFATVVKPGEVNLMVAGRGISHQEFSSSETSVLHGAQLWFALPNETRHMPPTFAHYVPEPILGLGSELRVFLGSLAGSTSPVETYTPPLVGAEAVLRSGARLELELNPSFEYGILLDTGELRLDGASVRVDHLVYLPPGRSSLVLEAGTSPVRILLIGGEPLGEQIVMWWNFIGRSHEEIVAYRAAWQAEIHAEPSPLLAADPSFESSSYSRFGPFPEGLPDPLPAPRLPNVQLRPRG